MKHAGRTAAGGVIAWAMRLLQRRQPVPAGRREGGGRGGGGGERPPDAGVREPRRPKPSPSAAAMAVTDDGDAVQR